MASLLRAGPALIITIACKCALASSLSPIALPLNASAHGSAAGISADGPHTAFEPVDPATYAQRTNHTGLNVNATFFANINKTVVPPVLRITNGTFRIIPLEEAGGIRSEDASTEGYNYGQALGLSWLFYEAQRSGKLAADNRIAWRGDSALEDVAPDGITDVTGGWYDAGDHLKLNFPAAWAASVLAWGVIEFQDGYAAAGQTQFALDSLRWIADYFVKCHYKDVAYVAQVGDPNVDHSYWGRPEDMTMPRPSYQVDDKHPGSDVLAQTAAALAAIALVFKHVDGPYSAILESHARDLYVIGATFQGKYSDSIAQAFVYPSSNWMDDMAWGGTWLYRLTGESQYLAAAISYWQRNKAEEGGGGYLAWNWDSSIWGADMMLAMLTNGSNPTYAAEVQRFLEVYVQGTQMVTYTPAGFAWASAWGSLRFTTNAAMLAMVYAKSITASAPAQAARYSCWARSQVRYILGDSGRSYMMGFGQHPTTHQHHRSSSCLLETGPPGSNVPPCSYSDFNLASPNPHILYGALAGGPAADDSYSDLRSNYQQNEPAVDYNSGFTGVLAALAQSTDTWQACLARKDVVHALTPATDNHS